MELTKKDKILILINLCLLIYFVSPASWYIQNITSVWLYSSVIAKFESYMFYMFILTLFALLISVTRVELTKVDKILIFIASTLFFARVIYFGFLSGLHITEDMILYLNLVEFITYMYIVALFALLVSVVRKMELTEKDKILVSIILCLFFVQVMHGMLDQLGVISMAVFTDYWLPVSFFVLFVWSWGIMIISPICLVLGHAFWDSIPYTICCILAWFSLFVLIKYTRGMKLAPRLVYLYLIPALIMSLAYLYHVPLH